MLCRLEPNTQNIYKHARLPNLHVQGWVTVMLSVARTLAKVKVK